MLEQYFIQCDLNGCCLRAPWIMEKDDFKYTLSFGEDVFGGPRWRDLVEPAQADEYQRLGTIPVLCDSNGRPILRNFVHVEDLVSALLAAVDHPQARRQTFNICMDEPGRLSRGGGTSGGDARTAECRHPHAVSQHRARQRQGPLSAGLATAV